EKKYTDLFDFYLRTSSRIIKRNIIEMLIRSGAFDDIYSNRASLLASIDQAESNAELFGDFVGVDDSLFNYSIKLKPSYIEKEDFTLLQKLDDEKELVGFYLSVHSLNNYRKELTKSYIIYLIKKKTKINKTRIINLKKNKTKKINTTHKIAVVVKEVRKIRTKRGDSMAFITVSDESYETEAVVFPEVYRSRNVLLVEGSIVELLVKQTERNGQKQLIVNDIKTLDLEATI